KELASVPALSDSQNLIDDFCNLFLDPQSRISAFLHDNAEKKQALLNQCSTEEERIEVLDALDRGRAENLEYIQYLQELVLAHTPKVTAVTPPPTLASNTYIARIRDLPTKVPSLQSKRGKKLVEALEHNHLGLQKCGSSYFSLELLKIRHELGDVVRDPEERKFVFELLEKFHKTGSDPPMPKRKQQDLDPEEAARRNAQNRQHQKDFRDRKRDMLRQLEEKVEQLQQELRITKEKLAAASLPASTQLLKSSPCCGSVSLQPAGLYSAVNGVVGALAGDVTQRAEMDITVELRYRVAELMQENSTLKILAGQHSNFELQARQALAQPVECQQSVVTATVSPTSTMNNSNSDTSPMLFDRCVDDIDDAFWNDILNFDDETCDSNTQNKNDSGIGDPRGLAAALALGAEGVNRSLRNTARAFKYKKEMLIMVFGQRVVMGLVDDIPTCQALVTRMVAGAEVIVTKRFASLVVSSAKAIVRLRKVESNQMTTNKRSLLIVLGSGGHTSEMLSLLKTVDKQSLSPRIYVAASTDTHSLEKAAKQDDSKDIKLVTIPRSREVGQSWIASLLATLVALFACVSVFWKHWPDVILCNGPGTCVPLCLLAVALKPLKQTRIVYVESFTRVNELSLSGKILYKLSDRFIVQWEQLQLKYPKAEYLGKLL
ncbi:UNVERIFIED_CONTAM: UDP-N-acetylglucosamine transferase subunit, partial [Siphonaria sp. JEL0065]